MFSSNGKDSKAGKLVEKLELLQFAIGIIRGVSIAQSSPEDLKGQYIMGSTLLAFATYKENIAQANNFGKYGSGIFARVGTALIMSADYQCDRPSISN